MYCWRQSFSLLSCHSLSTNHHIQYLSSIRFCRVDRWSCIFFMTSVDKFLYTSHKLSVNRFVGSAVILYFPCPLVGCRFLSLRHVLAHIPSLRRYIRKSGDLYYLPALCLRRRHHCQSLRSALLLRSPQAQIRRCT
jgi:hypothetical protein